MCCVVSGVRGGFALEALSRCGVVFSWCLVGVRWLSSAFRWFPWFAVGSSGYSLVSVSCLVCFSLIFVG